MLPPLFHQSIVCYFQLKDWASSTQVCTSWKAALYADSARFMDLTIHANRFPANHPIQNKITSMEFIRFLCPIPPLVKRVTFRDCLPVFFPEMIKSLHLYVHFLVDDLPDFPPQLDTLRMSCCVESLPPLPSTLRKFSISSYFSCEFSKTIERKMFFQRPLPDSLLELDLGKHHDAYLHDNGFPPNLQKVWLYDDTIDLSKLPLSLVYLISHQPNTLTLYHDFPDSLESLVLACHHIHQENRRKPNRIQYLSMRLLLPSCDDCDWCFPTISLVSIRFTTFHGFKSLLVLSLCHALQDMISVSYSLLTCLQSSLPNLLSLQIPFYNAWISHLPKLQTLCCAFSVRIEKNLFPPTLTRLTVRHLPNFSVHYSSFVIIDSLPSGLTFLHLACCDHSFLYLPDVLPTSLRELIVDDYPFPWDRSLVAGIEFVSIKRSFSGANCSK